MLAYGLVRGFSGHVVEDVEIGSDGLDDLGGDFAAGAQLIQQFEGEADREHFGRWVEAGSSHGALCSAFRHDDIAWLGCVLS